MPRLPANERLLSLAVAATDIFGRLGYRGTRTADVAARAGMSAGSLFTYVESKEALLHLVFVHGFGQWPESLPTLPLATPDPRETIVLVERGLAGIPMPRFLAALDVEEPADAASELRQILEERYAVIGRYWPVIRVIARCATEMPALEAVYFGRVRPGYYADLGHYLARRAAAGLLRAMPDSTVAARVVIESLSWFAWHRLEGRDSTMYDDETVRRTVIEFLCAALLPGSKQVIKSPATGSVPRAAASRSHSLCARRGRAPAFAHGLPRETLWAGCRPRIVGAAN
jgi:AcrR family transcriptional regulator